MSRISATAALGLPWMVATLGACQLQPADLAALAATGLAVAGQSPSPSGQGTSLPPGGGALPSPGAGTPATTSPAVGPGVLELPPKSQGLTEAFPVGANVKLQGTLLDGPNSAYTTLKVQVPEGPDGLWSVLTESPGAALSYRLLNMEKEELELKWVDMGQGKGTHALPLAGGRSYYFQWGGAYQARRFQATCSFEAVADPLESESLAQAKALKLNEATKVVLFQGHARGAGRGRDTDFFSVEVPPGSTKLRLKVENPESEITVGVKTYQPNAAGSPTDWSQHWGANPGANLNATMEAPASGRMWLEVMNAQWRNSTKAYVLTLMPE